VASSKRERELARRRVERQAARRAEAETRRRRRRALLIKITAGAVAAAVAVTLILLNVDFSSSSSSKTKAACTYKAAGTSAKPIKGLPSTSALEKPKTATLTTNRGTISIALLPDKAPCTINSFAFLAKQKYFDGTSCHRVTNAGIFVLQCGDPTASGKGGPGYQYPNENDKAFGTTNLVTYPKASVAMANAGEGTNGSQFFLVYGDSQLEPKYNVFGTITSGLDLVEAVGKAGPTSASDPKPKLPVTLTKVTTS
jgi:peptidyl-prolyl cis-trans isomerase B (cyclophilin B)